MRWGIVFGLVAFVVLVPSATAVANGKVAFLQRADLMVVNADGTGRQRLWTAPTCSGPEEYHCYPRASAWSPDGKRLAFVASYEGLRLINADGSGESRLVPDIHASPQAPVWSPDGTQLAFMSEAYPQGVARHDLYVVDVVSGSFRALTEGFSASGSPTWSPDGDEIAVRVFNELVVLDAEGSSRRTLVGPTVDLGGSPAWSSQDEIAYMRFSGGTPTVRVIRADGSGDRLLASVRGLPRAWSRDGEILLTDEVPYPSNGRAPIDGTRLFSVTRDGELTRLTHLQNPYLHNRGVAWSPDESRVVFWRTWTSPEPRSVVMTANADGTCERWLAMEAYTPAWQPVQEGPQGELRCTEMRILPEARSLRNDNRFSLEILNDGTETVGPIKLRGTLFGGSTFTVLPAAESCSAVATRAVECGLSRLSRGKSSSYLVDVRPRVVTRVNRLLRPTTVRFELEPVGEPYDVELRFSDCSVQDLGGGSIVGTRWNDLICGRRGADRITGGRGRDTILGGHGNDTLLARDRARDDVRCGRGRDRVVADRRDRVARDCERITRR